MDNLPKCNCYPSTTRRDSFSDHHPDCPVNLYLLRIKFWSQWTTVLAPDEWHTQKVPVNSFLGLKEETAELDGFCSMCHADTEKERYSERYSEPIEYDTNSGGDWWVSECCGERMYTTRILLPLSPGRMRYLYPEFSYLECDGSGFDDYLPDDYF